MAKNLTEEKKLILMSYITENQRLKTLKESEMVLIEKLLDYSNSNEQTAGNRKLSMRETEQKLKTEISHLKVWVFSCTLCIIKFDVDVYVTSDGLAH